jgi:L-fuconate dehydratase
VRVAAIPALEPFLVALPIDTSPASLGELWRRLVRDSQLRWLGPEKGVMHVAIAAVVDALVMRPSAARSARCGSRPASTCRTG